MSKLLIFDLDGVIFDSEQNMFFSWRAVQKKYIIKNTFDEYKKYIGLPFLKILKNLGINEHQKQIQKTYKEASIKYSYKVKLFPNVKKVLKKLSENYKLAIVTSKDFDRTSKLLKKHNLLFKCISCPKHNLRGKPFPDQINYVLKKLKIKKHDQVFYIGDTRFDYIAAKKARINFIHTKYGFEKKIKNVKKSIGNFSEITEVLDAKN